MVKYIDKNGIEYSSIEEFRQKNSIIFPNEVDDETLKLLELTKVEAKDDEKTLSVFKSKKLQELNDNFLLFRQNSATVKSSLGFVADATERALVDVSGLVSISATMPDAEIEFMDANNQVRLLKHADFIVLHREIAMNGSSVYKKKWEIRKRILESRSLHEIEMIQTGFRNAE